MAAPRPGPPPAAVRRALESTHDTEQALAELEAWLRERQVDLDRVLAQVVELLCARFAAERGTVFLVDHARNQVVSRVGRLPELAEIRLPIGEGVAGWVGKSGRPVCVPDTQHDARFSGRIDALTGFQTRSLVAVPMREKDGSVVGVLELVDSRAHAFGDETVEELVRLGAVVVALLGVSGLASQLQKAQSQPLSFRFNHIVGDSPVMHAVYDRTARAAATDALVLVRGESGSGKELVARAVHDNSARRDAPFVAVDCGALPAELVENELFGHVRGAFTGATEAGKGKVAAAEGGTLFLDEIGELPLGVQTRLLRLLQERTYYPVGAARLSQADVRFVCATNRGLEEMVAEGSFRRDLYYRLRVIEIRVPPLRARGHGDLDRLIDHFLFTLGRRYHREGIRLAAQARALLHAHRWPGNVRELGHVLESAIILSPGQTITPAQLYLEEPGLAAAGGPWEEGSDDSFSTEIRPLREVERDYIQWVLGAKEGNRSAAARALGIGRNTLNRKLRDED